MKASGMKRNGRKVGYKMVPETGGVYENMNTKNAIANTPINPPTVDKT
jgi:hypothetical protein